MQPIWRVPQSDTIRYLSKTSSRAKISRRNGKEANPDFLVPERPYSLASHCSKRDPRLSPSKIRDTPRVQNA